MKSEKAPLAILLAAIAAIILLSFFVSPVHADDRPVVVWGDVSLTVNDVATARKLFGKNLIDEVTGELRLPSPTIGCQSGYVFDTVRDAVDSGDKVLIAVRLRGYLESGECVRLRKGARFVPVETHDDGHRVKYRVHGSNDQLWINPDNFDS